MTLHIHAPKPKSVEVVKFHCSTCASQHDGLAEHFEWYGVDLTCLNCGEVFDEDGLSSQLSLQIFGYGGA